MTTRTRPKKHPSEVRSGLELGVDILVQVAKRAARLKGLRPMDAFASDIGRLFHVLTAAVPESERPGLWKKDLEDTAGWLLVNGRGTEEMRAKMAKELDAVAIWRNVLHAKAAFEVGRAVGEAARGPARASLG